jgi:7,8-dihydro-6-hydroxymethylpterin dimethyltransferase
VTIREDLRDYTFLGTTSSLCPECLDLVPAKIIERNGRVYFRKRCKTHGLREDFVCSDVRWYDRMEYAVPGRVPRKLGVDPDKGCPYDCGLCTDHEQHTCIGLVELTDACNLACPMCYAASGPGLKHRTFEECKAAIDRLVEVEGRAEVLQLSGGEPTIHPEFRRIFEYACDQAIDYVMINTNGIRLAHDPEFVDFLGSYKHRSEIYLQFDGLRDSTYRHLRGEPLLEQKLKAVAALGRVGLHTILVCTLQPGVNDDEIGDIVNFGLEREHVTGVSFQPATYSGRNVEPEDLEKRITFPDVVKSVCSQTDGLFEERDFMPLPCAHPNCHTLTYAYRKAGTVVPLLRFIDIGENIDLLANGITFTRPRARQLIERYLERLNCGSDCGCGPTLIEPRRAGGVSPLLGSNGSSDEGPGSSAGLLNVLNPSDNGDDPTSLLGNPQLLQAATDFFQRGLSESLAPEDVFRITITSFLDAYTFDVRRVMKCCVHHVLPSGHVVPFCAYNTLYRNGHVSLPELTRAAEGVGAAR